MKVSRGLLGRLPGDYKGNQLNTSLYPVKSHLRYLRSSLRRSKVYPCKLCMNGLKGTGELLRRYNTKQSLLLEPKCTSMEPSLNITGTSMETEIEQYWYK